MTSSSKIQATPEDAIYNSIQSATFEQTRDDGHVFAFGEGQKALVAKTEFKRNPKALSSGQAIDLLVEYVQDDHWVASARKAEKLAAFTRYKKMAKKKAIVQGTFIAKTSFGMSVDIGVRAGVPRNQIDVHQVHDPAPYVGRTVDFMVTHFDAQKCQVTVSRRKVLEREQKAARAVILDRIKEGEVFDGIVRSLKPYGVFVDLGGGVEGLLHVSNMSWGRIDHPNELVRPGDEVRVVVLDYKPKQKRIGLGRKQLLEDPWTRVKDTFNEGDTLHGKVVSLADFGAFVELAPGLEGLVHVTELSWVERIHHPRDVLELHQHVAVRIIGVNIENRRISLSIKQLKPNPWEEVATQLPAGARVTGHIRNITDFGVFVEVLPGVEGLVHLSNLSWGSDQVIPNKVYKVGDALEVMVLSVDVDAQRLDLGIKQLHENPWDVAELLAKPGKKIEATVARITDFGAFVTITEHVEGLIHISEISEDRVEEVSKHLRPGQTVQALVLSFDKENQRISMSLKRDALEEGLMRTYTDDGNSTSTLGDILRERLGLEAPSVLEHTEHTESQSDEAHIVASQEHQDLKKNIHTNNLNNLSGPLSEEE